MMTTFQDCPLRRLDDDPAYQTVIRQFSLCYTYCRGEDRSSFCAQWVRGSDFQCASCRKKALCNDCQYRLCCHAPHPSHDPLLAARWIVPAKISKHVIPSLRLLRGSARRRWKAILAHDIELHNREDGMYQHLDNSRAMKWLEVFIRCSLILLDHKEEATL